MFEYNRQLAKLGKPVDRDEWGMTPMTVNAYYNPVLNEIVFPAAILQPPFFDAAADDAVNYGAIGAVIGHEISHGFDDQGAQYDAQGTLKNWWTKDDTDKFKTATKMLVAQYDAYCPFPAANGKPALCVKGALTLGENIADLAGLTIAHDAYLRALGGKPAPVIEGLSGDQRFFLGWAQVWRRLYRDQELANRLVTDPHSPSEFRASVVRNLDAWYDAFPPQPGDALYLTRPTSASRSGSKPTGPSTRRPPSSPRSRARRSTRAFPGPSAPAKPAHSPYRASRRADLLATGRRDSVQGVFHTAPAFITQVTRSSIYKGLSRPLCAGKAGAFTLPRVASRGSPVHRPTRLCSGVFHTAPAFITHVTRSTSVMSASGLPATATRSACLPGAITPRSDLPARLRAQLAQRVEQRRGHRGQRADHRDRRHPGLGHQPGRGRRGHAPWKGAGVGAERDPHAALVGAERAPPCGPRPSSSRGSWPSFLTEY